ncbi:MAG: FxLYD domain-containing protein [Peptococcaceae bacterium]|nr:FxLYD domain-containing protein [Peptococcaceae bacterium]
MTSSAGPEQGDAAKPLDLQGSWVAETPGNGYYLAGFIKDDLIELHWVSSYDQAGSVYWAGTYSAPKKDTDTYSWVSDKNADIMATSYYAAPEDTRNFKYENGKLILEASDLGSQEVVLIRSDVDYTGLAVQIPETEENQEENQGEEDSSKDAAKAAEEDVKDIKLVNSGYSVVTTDSGDTYVYYAVELSNPNKYNAILSPNIEITVTDSDGNLVTKQNKNLVGLAPREKLTYGDTIKCHSSKLENVNIKVKNSDYDIVSYDTSGVNSVKDLKVTGVKKNENDDRVTFSGNVTNTTDHDIAGVVVSVIYYKAGDIVGGSTEYLDTLTAGQKANFTVRDKGGFTDYDEYEVIATQE